MVSIKAVLITLTGLRLKHVTAVSASGSRLQVQIPSALKKEGGYEHREALFGISPYGGSIQQQVYYADSTLCDARVDATGGFPQRADNTPWKAPFILMIDRGVCSFVSKVRNAQMVGASGVLIADNICQCSAKDCQNEPTHNDCDGNEPAANDDDETGNDAAGNDDCQNRTPSNQCEATEPIMADDGSGGDVSIPAFLLFKQDADPIKAALKLNQIVRVEMSFPLPAPDSRVEYDLWTTPVDSVSRPFQSSFKEGAEALGKDAFFTPHMYIFDGIRAGCQGFNGENECVNLCTNNGRYCATDPNGDLDSGASGADVVKESLRRLCIWQSYGKDGVGREWWDYTKEFVFRCDNPDKAFFNNEECAVDAMAHAGVDANTVDRCMSDSGGLEQDSTNTLLEAELSNRQASGVGLIPSLFVNQAPVRGQLSFANTFKAICAGYAPGYEPSVCQKCMTCQDEEGCVTKGRCEGAAGIQSRGVSASTFVSAMGILTLVFGSLGFIQFRRQQRAMRDQVRGIIAEYMPVDENQKQMDNSVGIKE
jgi:hypothetical protein